jgi:hypothetical protein
MTQLHDYTHALVWCPPWLLPAGSEPFWEVVPWREFLFPSRPRHAGIRVYPDPAGTAPAGELTDWAAMQMGYPVELTPSAEQQRRRRFWGRWQPVPCYFVRAAQRALASCTAGQTAVTQ